MHKLINAALFQACWFCAILLGWTYALIPLAAMAMHGILFESKQHRYRFVILFVVLGCLFDSAMKAAGHYTFVNNASGLIPLWLVCLWCGFALTLASSMSWWQRYPKAFVVACALAAPMSYLAGMRLGALEITSTGFVLISLAWSCLALFVIKLPPSVVSELTARKKYADSKYQNGHQICGQE